jgi:hypothetical protein
LRDATMRSSRRSPSFVAAAGAFQSFSASEAAGGPRCSAA